MNALTRIYQQNRIREGLPPSPDPLAVEGRPSERDAQAPPVNGAGSATIVKHCSCGATYTVEQWCALPVCGTQRQIDGPDLDVRHCPCGSSVAIEVTK
jgi:hypothetical protein